MAMVPAAPVTFSMMNCWPSSLPMRSPMMRGRRSVGPPAAKGTIMVTGLVGQAWPKAGAAASTRAAASMCLRNIVVSSLSAPAEHGTLDHAKPPGDQEAEDGQHDHAGHQLVGLHQVAGLQHEGANAVLRADHLGCHDQEKRHRGGDAEPREDAGHRPG